MTALALLLGPAVARADDASMLDARAAYDRGAKAYDAGEYTTATVELARADQLAPNGTVLELALKSALRGDDALIAMSLVERAERRGLQGGGAEVAQAVRARFEGRVGRIAAHCRATCTVLIDGSSAGASSPRWVLPGPHEVEISTGAARERRTVLVAAGAFVQVEQVPPAPVRLPATPPPLPASASAPADGRVSPAVFWIGLGATALLGAAAIASGVDTRERHDQFMQAPSDQSAQDGRGAQLRTNVLIGATIATGVLTGALGIFAIRWSS